MKYGLLKYSSYNLNIGDYMQLEGIKQAYKRMNISKEDIIEIERDMLADYEGEYVILPMTGYFAVPINVWPLSPKIIPVFIGFFAGDEVVAKEMAKYEKFGPFGCRDLVTMKLMQQQGVQAYMSGCFSIGFEKRKENPQNGKIYLCDPPEELIPYIPRDYMENAVELPIPQRNMKSPGYKEDNEKMAKEYIDHMVAELKTNAKLVITRRLHMALPCIAMGIPVILAHKCDSGLVEDCRFAGLDRIVKVYKPKEYGEIDWNPKAPDIEWLKEKTIQLGMQRIREAEQKWRLLCELSEYYESAPSQIYYSGMKASYLSEQQKQMFLKNAWKLERTVFEFITKKDFENMHLVLYGAGDKGKWAIRRYQDYIRRAAKFSIVDGDVNKHGKGINDVMPKDSWDFCYVENYIIENPQIIRNIRKENLVVVITCDKYYAGAGAEIGNMLMKEYSLEEEKELYFLDKLNNSMDLHMSVTSTPVSWLHGF